MLPAELQYTEEHEWIRLEGDTATIGITDYAQEQLTDIVFVELPEVGRTVNAGDDLVVLESVKSVADVYAPMAGEVVEVNSDLEDHPEWVNESPYGKGWLYKLKTDASDTVELLTAETYQAFIDAQ